MSAATNSPLKKTEFKYKIGKIKQMPTVQMDLNTNLSYIELNARKNETIYGCTMFKNHYKEEKKLGQGTFGAVYKGIHLETQRQVAMKRIIMPQESDLFPITAQREITILRKLNNKHIVKLIEMVYDTAPEPSNSNANYSNNAKDPSLLNKSFYMILPYMIADLSGLLHNPRITLPVNEVKNMMLQLLEGINYLHCEKYMHRDIKTANILIDHTGTLKLADFGLARMYYGTPPNLKYPGGAGIGAKYTGVVVTRWYRAPELVLGDKQYTTAVDLWGIGCVFAEFFEKKPILQGNSDIDQGHVIFKLLGTPTKESWDMAAYLPGAELLRTSYPETLSERFGKFLTATGLDFLRSLLSLNPYKRLTAMSALQHPFFKEEPLPSKHLTCLTEESHESDIKRYKEEMHQSLSQRVPTAPKGHINEKGMEKGKQISQSSDINAPERYYAENTFNNNNNNFSNSRSTYPNQSNPNYRSQTYKGNQNRYNNNGPNNMNKNNKHYNQYNTDSRQYSNNNKMSNLPNSRSRYQKSDPHANDRNPATYNRHTQKASSGNYSNAISGRINQYNNTYRRDHEESNIESRTNKISSTISRDDSKHENRQSHTRINQNSKPYNKGPTASNESRFSRGIDSETYQNSSVREHLRESDKQTQSDTSNKNESKISKNTDNNTRDKNFADFY
ncbi:hypothetical protein TPHA_0I03100 [Tetrapisispora phaffii CBS 4417]|uniref:Serine/threonine-protein kinase BUR1 n=1 Tax=Tetrapisispora phaffii (strain ATCC 24235 / CBS 4417 / NBRC 1672 / NRRL Y-8282 / UCD 70-5) TaxID=1071381 RepID=G8BY33_TETPH|nr:hypothetical protein TPHA_0I03100 [Tetrapisispora phaffii CBS 4417]CCE64811.1 hypothetical protein TPHA_0I03100 [Tetrapisispora phaffii CBS 4417]